MKNIGSGMNLIEDLYHNNALLDARIHRINMFEDSSDVVVQLEMTPREGSFPTKLLLELRKVKEYYFCYEQPTIFYDVERYKLFQTEEGDFYLSIDPFDEDKSISKEDNGVIRAEAISGFLI
jgi:hypothetical protein